jgi:DNA-binding FadR family transcriptional regulator
VTGVDVNLPGAAAARAEGARARPTLGLRPAPAPRSRLRLTNEIVESIADQIIGGRLPAQTLLPSEAEMAESFGVSRTVIRESLKVLENTGLILKRQGKLSWTAPPQSWDLLDPMVLAARVRHDRDLGFLDDLVTVRAALEAEMAAQAAERAGDDEVEEVAERLRELERELDEPERYKVDETRFHDAVMRASHNDVAAAIVKAIADRARASAQYADAATPAALVRHSHGGHVEVMEALRARDAERAARAMREHIRPRGLGGTKSPSRPERGQPTPGPGSAEDR